MKKTFLIAGFSVLNICSAQNFFELPKNGIICDVPGQTFFYSYLNGDALIVSEYDETGNILETDSVDVYVGSISNKVISLLPFGTSQEYLIIYRSILPSVVYTTSDTTLYTFVRYSGVTDQIEAVNNDTLINYFLHSESYNDTSVYLFEDHYFGYSGFQYPTNTLEVGPDLILDQIAPLDSIEKSYLANSYEFINDSFLVFQEVGQYSVALGSFAPDGSNYSEQDHILMPVADYNYIDFFSLVGQDSILLFYQGSNSGTYVNTWNFYLFDLQLNVINSSQTLSKNVFHPFWGEYLYYDRMSAEGVGVFQDKIYLLAHLTGDDSIKIFRYDLNFNLECDMTIEAYGNHFTGNFEIING
ncbi:MAG: hypothetical protein JNJ99_10910, partial [Crocinitomicaceae bacterium]|nr:hypothetical protein [Crocinitomicaceae bacterium]